MQCNSADGATPTWPVISEYHAIGSVARAYMLRFGRYKYRLHVAHPLQLFDLAADSEKLVDLAADSRHAATLAEGDRLLRAALDPEQTDGRAKRRRPSFLRPREAGSRRWRAATWLHACAGHFRGDELGAYFVTLPCLLAKDAP